MEVAARIQPNVAPGVHTQTSADSSADQQKKPFDPEQLKDEKAALGVARELAAAQSDSQGPQRMAQDNVSDAKSLAPARDNAEWRRTEGAPNWSTLSAADKGYTMSERAINLYRHINTMAM